jgi:hypothetical protein
MIEPRVFWVHFLDFPQTLECYLMQNDKTLQLLHIGNLLCVLCAECFWHFSCQHWKVSIMISCAARICLHHSAGRWPDCPQSTGKSMSMASVFLHLFRLFSGHLAVSMMIKHAVFPLKVQVPSALTELCGKVSFYLFFWLKSRFLKLATCIKK